MKLTALEIKQRTFDKALRGYDIQEVTAFLNVVSSEWENEVAKTRELERELQYVREKLKHYERVESALHETLQTAKESSDKRLETARREAKSKIEKAELEAEQIVMEARKKRQEIKQSIQQLLERREEIINGIESYLDVARKSMEGFVQKGAELKDLSAIDDSPPAQAARKKPPSNENQPEQPNRSHPQAEDIDDLLDRID